MNRLYSPSYLREILDKHNFKFSKALGQNFLIDGNVVRKIADGAGVGEGDLVVEVGPGAGTLTEEMALRGARVIAIELDDDLIPILEETLGNFNNVTLIHQDAMTVDFLDLIKDYEGRAKFISNLPYNIGTALIADILEKRIAFESLTIMLQKEVGDRFLAQASGKDYGSISVLADYFTQGESLLTVSKNSFIPQPKIDSLVFKLTVKEVPKPAYEDLMFSLVKSAFTQRRKTIPNSLTALTDITKAQVNEALEKLGISPKLRAEDLGVEDFKKIAGYLSKKNESFY